MHRTVLASLLLLSGCATASLEPSARREVAVANAATEDRANWAARVRVRAGQVFVPSRADGQDEFCSTSPVMFLDTGRPLPMCFRDTDGRGRFNRAFLVREKREGGIEVNVPYTAQPFPCSPCVVTATDLTTITDPQMLAEQSIAPPELRPYVQLAVAGSPDVDPAIARSSLPDKAAARSAVTLATREVRDRRAVAICSSQNPGGGVGAFGLLGALAAIAGGRSEQNCMDEYLRTGVMPVLPAPVAIPAASS